MFSEKTDFWILDDNPLRRAAFEALFKQCAEFDNIVFKTCGTNGFEHRQNCPMVNSLVLLVLGGQHLGEETARRALSSVQQTYSTAPIVVMLDNITGSDIDFALTTGLRGLICTKDDTPVALAAIRFLVAGGSYIPHDRAYTSSVDMVEPEAVNNPVTADVAMAKDQAVRMSDTVTTLTRRQEEVFAVLAKGASNKSIARTLSLSEATVKIHVRNIFRKLSVNNRVQAALFAYNTMAE